MDNLGLLEKNCVEGTRGDSVKITLRKIKFILSVNILTENQVDTGTVNKDEET